MQGKQVIIVDKWCKSIFSQARGLMFALRPQTLVMEFKTMRRISLHMWFVFFPIDVLLLDANKKIVEIKRNFRPWQFYSSKNEAKVVVEMRSSSRNNFKVGQRVVLRKNLA